jgi:uncharacterized protein YjbI with pentapeptide repeats
MSALYASVLDRLTEGRKLPKGTDTWAFKSVKADLRTSHGYRWPYPGKWAECDPDKIITENKGSCPRTGCVGDGLCVATTYAGMKLGGIPARTMLLVAYHSKDLLGNSEAGKLRVARVRVVELLDGETVLKSHGAKADLTRADLTGANLTGADLTGADLTGADLTGADLYEAYLTGANLTEAYLTRADLSGANLTGADLTGAYLYEAYLTGADLTGAYLTGAYLTRADLTGADLTGADLTGADLTGADLTGADLTGADLTGADLTGARHDQYTRWPEGFTPPVSAP